jgi:hypothetical protein
MCVLPGPGAVVLVLIWCILRICISRNVSGIDAVLCIDVDGR